MFQHGSSFGHSSSGHRGHICREDQEPSLRETACRHVDGINKLKLDISLGTGGRGCSDLSDFHTDLGAVLLALL